MMQYRLGKHNESISLLGYGCMRFTRTGGKIDLEKAEQEVLSAIKDGVNYFDTAYIYPGNEVALGSILSKNQIREEVMIATKLPQYLIKSTAGIDRHFNEQLSRLKTTYIDFYLMHMITDIASWHKLVDLGILEWIERKKASGEIRNIGFSFHGNTNMFLEILEAYQWDFCQIQYNYMDEHTQAGRSGLDRAYEKDIPVIIMEPLRGGKLVDLLPTEAKSAILNNERHYSPAEWAFRWLMQQPAVTCVLSGMNSLEMVAENIRIASTVQVNEFTPSDYALIDTVKEAINHKIKVNCTACGYCMPCVNDVDIPGVFRCYNVVQTDGKRTALREYFQTTALRKKSSGAHNCIKCGKCVSHCPQSINIPEQLACASKELDTFYIRVVRWFVQRFKLW